MIKMSTPKNDSKQKRHEQVGPADQWLKRREFQIKFLKKKGLDQNDFFLDLGCGNLRGGIPIIEFLETGHYYGIDVRSSVLEEAKKELTEEGLLHKAPKLILTKNFSSLTIEKKFHIIWAFSVLVHLTDEKLDSLLEFVSRHLEKRGTFYANVKIGEPHEGKWKEFPHVWRTFEFYREKASRHGLKVSDDPRFHLENMHKNKEMTNPMLEISKEEFGKKREEFKSVKKEYEKKRDEFKQTKEEFEKKREEFKPVKEKFEKMKEDLV